LENFDGSAQFTRRNIGKRGCIRLYHNHGWWFGVEKQNKPTRGGAFNMLRDLRFAARMLTKNPAATAVAVISLAIAIGPNCALFSVVDRLILKPPPVQGIGHIFDMDVRTDRPGEFQFTSYPDLQDFQRQAGDVALFAAAFDREGAVLNSAGQRQTVPMEIVSENYFSVLGARAMVGRTLQESDEHFEGQPPAVISYSMWQRYLGGASDVVGKAVFLSGRAYTLVGVMPRGFIEPGLQLLPMDVWVPFNAWPAAAQQNYMQRGRSYVGELVRLRDGVDKARAEAVLTAVARRIASQFPDTYKGKTVSLRSLEEGHDTLATIILSLAGLVVLIACANIAGILMAQGEARRQEFAVRAAMGASRVRLVRQLTAETLLLSLAAGGVGLLAAFWLIRALPALQPLWVLSLDFDFQMDSRVLAYALAITLLTAVAAGLVPSLRASRPDLVPTLKGDAPAGGRHFRFRGALVIGQIAISQFLLVGAGLLFRSYQEAQRMRPGFDPGRKVLAAFLTAPAEDKTVDFARLADRLREVPGVVRVSFTNFLPLSGMGGGKRRVLIPGVTSEPAEVGSRAAGADYFAIMGTQLLRGRDFERSDARDVVVVNETMARQFWGSPDAAMGRVFRMDENEYRIIGVAENGNYESLYEPPMPFVFAATPLPKRGEGTLLIETAAPPSAMAGAIRKAIQDTDPDAFVASLATLRQSMQISLYPYRVAAGLIGTIAILGIFLSGVGLYGLIAYSVSRRAHEIGIRVAMGAERTDVLALVFRETVSRLAIGSVIGLAVALAAAEVLRSALYGVSPTDPIGIAVAVAVTAAVGLLASYAPARRALGVDPANALRQE
jgi:predicted permease